MATGIYYRGDTMPFVCPLTRADGTTFVIDPGTTVRARIINKETGLGPTITCSSSDTGAVWGTSVVAAIFYPVDTNDIAPGPSILEIEVDEDSPSTFQDTDIVIMPDYIRPS